MNWEDEGYLLSKRKFRENANIINVFTNTFGKVSGIVYGGSSRKISCMSRLSTMLAFRCLLHNNLSLKMKPLYFMK